MFRPTSDGGTSDATARSTMKLTEQKRVNCPSGSPSSPSDTTVVTEASGIGVGAGAGAGDPVKGENSERTPHRIKCSATLLIPAHSPHALGQASGSSMSMSSVDCERPSQGNV
eukprot:scaffold4482_cov393-Prasinococcus_capsulatus_cf.AAC.8